jgi:hypothetical protein
VRTQQAAERREKAAEEHNQAFIKAKNFSLAEEKDGDEDMISGRGFTMNEELLDADGNVVSKADVQAKAREEINPEENDAEGMRIGAGLKQAFSGAMQEMLGATDEETEEDLSDEEEGSQRPSLAGLMKHPRAFTPPPRMSFVQMQRAALGGPQRAESSRVLSSPSSQLRGSPLAAGSPHTRARKFLQLPPQSGQMLGSSRSSPQTEQRAPTADEEAQDEDVAENEEEEEPEETPLQHFLDEEDRLDVGERLKREQGRVKQWRRARKYRLANVPPIPGGLGGRKGVQLPKSFVDYKGPSYTLPKSFVHTALHTKTHTHTYTHIHIHIYIHTHTHTHSLTHIRTHTHTHARATQATHARARTHAHIHTNRNIRAHTHTCTHTHTHTHKHTHMHTHTHIHTHTHRHTHTHTHIYTHMRKGDAHDLTEIQIRRLHDHFSMAELVPAPVTSPAQSQGGLSMHTQSTPTAEGNSSIDPTADDGLRFGVGIKEASEFEWEEVTDDGEVDVALTDSMRRAAREAWRGEAGEGEGGAFDVDEMARLGLVPIAAHVVGLSGASVWDGPRRHELRSPGEVNPSSPDAHRGRLQEGSRITTAVSSARPIHTFGSTALGTQRNQTAPLPTGEATSASPLVPFRGADFLRKAGESSGVKGSHSSTGTSEEEEEDGGFLISDRPQSALSITYPSITDTPMLTASQSAPLIPAMLSVQRPHTTTYFMYPSDPPPDRLEGREQRAEDRSPRAEDRSPRAEDRSPRAGGRIEELEAINRAHLEARGMQVTLL